MTRRCYTWRWEQTQMDSMGETLVTVEFRDRGAATEVALTHDLFPDTALRDRHIGGWSACLDQLTALLAAL